MAAICAPTHVLKHDDHVQIGEHVLRFVAQGTAYAEFTSNEHPSTMMSVRDLLQEDQQAATKLRALLEIVHNLGHSLELRQIFPNLLDCAFRIFPQAQRGCILLAEGPAGELVPQAVKHRDPNASGRASISRTIVKQVMTDGQAVLSDNAGADHRFQSDSIYQLDLRSIICAPILGAQGAALGMIQLDSSEIQRRFTRDDLAVLVNVANLAGQSVEHARLHQRELRFERRQHDLEVARRVQLHFLPQQPIDVPGYSVRHYYAAADEVGGDYFGYLPLLDGRWGFAIADVAGKGLPAALLMAHFCGDVRYCMAVESDLAAAATRLNSLLCEMQAYDRFVTFALCVLDATTHQVSLVNAGHPPPLLRTRSGKVEHLGAGRHGPPLGVSPDWRYETTTVQLQPDESILMYTDGVSDARNTVGDLYGMKRVEQFMQADMDADQRVPALQSDLAAFTLSAPQADDTCIVAFTRLK